MNANEFCNTPGTSWRDWYADVDARIIELAGVGRDDLPDCPYRDWYDSEVNSEDAAMKALAAAGHPEFE